MIFKKQEWIPYGKKARYLNIGVKDNFKQTIESFELEKGKDIDNKRILKKIKDYGFDLSETQSIDEIKNKDNKRWLDKNMEW